MNTFYIVSTPIGNLEDITLRALSVLKSVDLILCEDTRVTRHLLENYHIETKTQSYHAHSKLSKVDYILGLLEEGKNIALVSDAGTPTISDPGILLIQKIKETLPEVKIVSIPGASALLCGLTSSALNAHEFTFLGFLPHKKGRETLFAEIENSRRTIVFYESVHRIIKTLERLSEVLSPERKISVGRELTKMFQEVLRGTLSEAIAHFQMKEPRGEFVVLLAGNK